MSSTGNGARRYRPCPRCTISFENMVHGRKRPNCLFVATAETRGQIQNLQKIAGTASQRGQWQRRARELGETMRLLSRHSFGGMVVNPGKDGW